MKIQAVQESTKNLFKKIWSLNAQKWVILSYFVAIITFRSLYKDRCMSGCVGEQIETKELDHIEACYYFKRSIRFYFS